MKWRGNTSTPLLTPGFYCSFIRVTYYLNSHIQINYGIESGNGSISLGRAVGDAHPSPTET